MAEGKSSHPDCPPEMKETLHSWRPRPALPARLLTARPFPITFLLRGFLLVLMHPTLVPLRNLKTASVTFSFHSHPTEGALGCFRPHAFLSLSTFSCLVAPTLGIS